MHSVTYHRAASAEASYCTEMNYTGTYDTSRMSLHITPTLSSLDQPPPSTAGPSRRHFRNRPPSGEQSRPLCSRQRSHHRCSAGAAEQLQHHTAASHTGMQLQLSTQRQYSDRACPLACCTAVQQPYNNRTVGCKLTVYTGNSSLLLTTTVEPQQETHSATKSNAPVLVALLNGRTLTSPFPVAGFLVALWLDNSPWSTL